MRTMTVAVATSFMAVLALEPLSAEPTAPGCDCPAVATAIVQCYQAMWPRFAEADPRTQDELEAHLDAMWEGIEKGKEPADYGCHDEPSEDCADECMAIGWQAFLELARSTSKPYERWGAITLVFGAYMDIGPPDDVLPMLEEVALDFLQRPRDTMTTQAVLRMMKFYRFPAEPMSSTLLKLMEGEPVLVRDLAFQRFAQYTRCVLRFDPHADAKKRARQVGKIRRWWSTQERGVE